MSVPEKTKRPAQRAAQKWQLQTAKSQFSELFRRARAEGPQHVTKQGKEEVVVLAKEEFDRLTGHASGPGSVWDFFRSSPLVGLEIDLERDEDFGREVDL